MVRLAERTRTDCWPRIVDAPDVSRWAREFIDSGRADVTT
jgi:hypothetical protein